MHIFFIQPCTTTFFNTFKTILQTKASVLQSRTQSLFKLWNDPKIIVYSDKKNMAEAAGMHMYNAVATTNYHNVSDLYCSFYLIGCH